MYIYMYVHAYCKSGDIAIHYIQCLLHAWHVGVLMFLTHYIELVQVIMSEATCVCTSFIGVGSDFNTLLHMSVPCFRRHLSWLKPFLLQPAD